MRILICDDETFVVENIKKLLRCYFKNNKLKCPEIIGYTSGYELIEDIGDKDIVFIDIEMPGVNGIFIGNYLAEKNPQVIIFVVTSYLEYLDEAMKFHVFRYLSKPIDKQRFYRNFKDAVARYYTSSKNIAIETKEGVHTVSVSDLMFIEARGRKVMVHTNKDVYISTRNMSEWKNMLPTNLFYQTHRSYIVNFEHISDFNHETIYIKGGKDEVYLTRRKYTQFKDAYLLYLESVR